MKIGIDVIKFYTARYYLEANDLAQSRDVDSGKYFKGLGIKKISVMPPDEDIITMAANAGKEVLRYVDINKVDMLLFATESGVDQSKSSGMWVHKLLNLPETCRVVELKQACYSATAAIRMAFAMVYQNPESKIMVIASDNARYELNSPGEPTQGCGAVAMIISTNPRVLSLQNKAGVYAKDAMDFWRPNYRTEPFVNGGYSIELYLKALSESWKQYSLISGNLFDQHYKFCYHSPFPKMAEKAHAHLFKENNNHEIDKSLLKTEISGSLKYGRIIGNTYTASLYICLISLLENTKENLAGKIIGLYSYGSGCIGEFFSVVIEAGYKEVISAELHDKLLNTRQRVSISQYEAYHNFSDKMVEGNHNIPHYEDGQFRLFGFKDHMRLYEELE